MTLDEMKRHAGLNAYVELLLQWNKGMNLIGKSTIAEVWENHIADSLELLPYLPSPGVVTQAADIGSGGGMPGIPLAFFRPDLHFILTDVDSKKLAFLTFAVKKLGLNASVRDLNLPFLLNEPCLITSRAFSELKNIFAWAARHTPQVQQFCLLKGRDEVIERETEAARLPYSFELQRHELKKGHVLLISQFRVN